MVSGIGPGSGYRCVRVPAGGEGPRIFADERLRSGPWDRPSRGAGGAGCSFAFVARSMLVLGL